jgi:hypothetical protein
VISDNYSPKYTSKQLQERLEKYYKENSTDSLRSFLNEWNKILTPVTNEFIQQDDAIENIYQVMIDLYKPFKFGDYQADNYFKGKNEFIIIQKDIDYAVVSSKEYQSFIKAALKGYPYDTVYEYYKTKRLNIFRPKLSIDSVKYLYLTKEYEKALTDFLGTEHHELGEGDIMNTAYPKNETANRYHFLCPILPIVYGHWGGYWHIETFPIIYKIVFDDFFKHAFVDFRSSVGQTVIQYELIKKDGKWKSDYNKIAKIRQE